MTTTGIIILYGMLFFGVLLATTSAFSLVRPQRASAKRYVNRRLMLHAESGASVGDVLSLLRRPNGEAKGLMRLIPFSMALTSLIHQSGMSVSPQKIARLILGLGILWSILIWIVMPLPQLKLLALAGPLLAALPIVFVLKMVRDKRIKSFEAQLPDALDLMVRSLRIGHPVSASIGLVAREMQDPIGSEFGIAFDEVTYGSDVSSAFADLAGRVPVSDLEYVSVAIQIQEESGGNLAEVLSGLSKVIRDRFRMFRKVRAITAEGRFSAWFLSGFPLFIAAMIQLIKPDYYTQVMNVPLFAPLATATAVLLIMNVVAMRILTNIKV